MTTIEKYMPTDPIMRFMWCGSIQFAIGEKKILDAFRKETGLAYSPPKSPLEKMIDDATGFNQQAEEFFVAFAKWHNANIWGEEDGKPIDAPKGAVK